MGAVAPAAALDGGVTRFQEPIWPILVDNTAKSVLFTWVFLNTRGSLLLAILLHASTNLSREYCPVRQARETLHSHSSPQRQSGYW